MAACKDDNLDILERVLAADASAIDINHTDAAGNTALHYAYVKKKKVIEGGGLIIYSCLFETDLHLSRFLINSATNASTGCLEILMYYDGINVNGVDPATGDTPLHKAAAFQDPELALEMVQILVTRGGASVTRKGGLFFNPCGTIPCEVQVVSNQ
jgi:ankyrin repeat protein